jgi:predicted metal-dependent phosphotriesterase family hydrolase
MHEHVFCRVRPENLDTAREFVVQELALAATHGIRTIVDLTTYVLPDAFLDVLHQQPVRIICCAGYYLKKTIPGAFRSLDREALADRLREKCDRGIGRRRIKPGIIKIATSAASFSRLEQNILYAAATVHGEFRLPIATHACRGGRQQLQGLLELGVDPRRVFLSHLETELKGSRPRSFSAVADDVLWILETGAYVFFGDFSVRDSEYRREVLQLFRLCSDHGYKRQLFISADSHWSVRRGHMRVRGSSTNGATPRTYEYTLTHIAPMLIREGFTESDVETWLVNNPAEFFSCKRDTQ